MFRNKILFYCKIMNIYLIGHKGWIGKMYLEELKDKELLLNILIIEQNLKK